MEGQTERKRKPVLTIAAAIQCTLLDESYEVGLTRQMDDGREILAVLRELDASGLTPWSGESLASNKSGFYYESFNRSPYYLCYHNREKCLRIVRSYEDPFGRTRNLHLRYALSAEDGDRLMAVAEKVIREKEQSAGLTVRGRRLPFFRPVKRSCLKNVLSCLRVERAAHRI